MHVGKLVLPLFGPSLKTANVPIFFSADYMVHSRFTYATEDAVAMEYQDTFENLEGH